MRPAKSLVLLFAAALMPAQASAQLVGDTSPEVRRPYRGLFGSLSDPNAPQSLVLSASLFGAYDDNLLGGERSRPTADPSRLISGYYGGAQSALSYLRATDAYNVGLDVGALYRYYPDQSYGAPTYNESFNVGTGLWHRARLNVNQGFVYTPNYRLNLLPGIAGIGNPPGAGEIDNPDDGALDPDLDLFKSPAYRHHAGVSFSQSIKRRSDFHGGYRFRYVDFTEDAQQDFKSHAVSVGFSHRLTSHASLKIGYGRRTSDNLAGTRAVHNIDAGVDYSRAISLSRRTMFAFSTGSAMQVSDRLEAVSDPRTRFHFIGSARLIHEIGRTWTAAAAYRRSLNLREGFDQPLITDAVTSTLGGLVTRRLNLSVSAGWVRAAGTLDGRTAYDAITASTQAQYALNRFLAVFARYFYYDYEFADVAALDPSLGPSAQRNGVRVGVTTTLPLIR
jgi:hypothetical protein